MYGASEEVPSKAARTTMAEVGVTAAGRPPQPGRLINTADRRIAQTNNARWVWIIYLTTRTVRTARIAWPSSARAVTSHRYKPVGTRVPVSLARFHAVVCVPAS